MNLVQTEAGALQILLDALGASPDLACRLYSNNYAVIGTTDRADVTEATFTGYVAATPTWSTPALVAGVPTTVPSPTNVDFTYTGGSTATVYGAFLTNSADTKWYGATTFTAPWVFTTTITTLSLYPTYTQKGEFTTS